MIVLPCKSLSEPRNSKTPDEMQSVECVTYSDCDFAAQTSWTKGLWDLLYGTCLQNQEVETSSYSFVSLEVRGARGSRSSPNSETGLGHRGSVISWVRMLKAPFSEHWGGFLLNFEIFLLCLLQIYCWTHDQHMGLRTPNCWGGL